MNQNFKICKMLHLFIFRKMKKQLWLDYHLIKCLWGHISRNTSSLKWRRWRQDKMKDFILDLTEWDNRAIWLRINAVLQEKSGNDPEDNLEIMTAITSVSTSQMTSPWNLGVRNTWNLLGGSMTLQSCWGRSSHLQLWGWCCPHSKPGSRVLKWGLCLSFKIKWNLPY